MILCYPFKLKYLNQKFFYPTLKKRNFFSWKHRIYILMGFKSHIWKKKKNTPGLGRVSPESRFDPPSRSGLTGSLHWPIFWQTWTGPAPRSTGSRVDPPGRVGFNNYYGLRRGEALSWQWSKKLKICNQERRWRFQRIDST